jgi:hypothetical protein
MRKRLLVALVAVVVIVLVALGLRLPALAHIGTGYSAEQVCACVFISGRTPESCHGDLDPLARKLISVKVGANEVTARGMGLSHARARYEKGFGCTLLE